MRTVFICLHGQQILEDCCREFSRNGSDVSQIWAQSTSIIGSGFEAKPQAIQVSLDLDGTIVNPGDLIFSDPTNGVIVIPQDRVADVVDLLPQLVEADDRVKEDVLKGMTVTDAFKKHRSH